MDGFQYYYTFSYVTKAADAGGSIVVHLFGAVFGLAVSWTLMLRDRRSYNRVPDLQCGRNANLFSMIGLPTFTIYSIRCFDV